ncbi:hypothetical protein ACOACO_15030 [Nocardioides sp. CPCC 205120]|uniref:hypothetical protein n=1 Tax=Nocardioides sp. CPCC 205120 TaxID=3406462 RepID=UPI003B5101EB
MSTSPARRPLLAPALALAVAGTALSACTTAGGSGGGGWGSGATYPDATDLRRATAVWQDPWVAPTEALTAGPTSGPDAVTRTVGHRTTGYGDAPAGADPDRWTVGLEVEAAVASGWRLHAVDCAEPAAYLVRGDVEDLDTLRTALVVAGTDGVDVTAYVPHHRDGSWPDPGPVRDPATTCLSGAAGAGDAGDAAGLPDELDELDEGDPFPGDGATGDDERAVPRWPADDADDADDADVEARVAEVGADPWVAALPHDVPVPPAGDDDWRRDAPLLRERVPAEGATPAARLAATVAAVLATGTADAWAVTWVSCHPGDPARPAAATLRRTGEAGTAVLALTAAGDDTAVEARLVLPPAGWRAGTTYVDGLAALPPVPPAAVAGCGRDAAAPVTAAPVTAGTPAVLPASAWPTGE